jgi:high-affinity nickel-transport protein
MRHATDSDHVVAVTTIVSRERSVRFAGAVGIAGGVGHTLTILVVGGAIILFRVVIPPRLGLSMEFAVALMLVGLGGVNLADRLRGPYAPHEARRPHPRGANLLVRPLLVGVVHGLAGSAAIALLVLATITDPRWAFVYLLLFGVGTVGGMMLLTSAIAIPFAVAADRFARINLRMVQLTALASVVLGLMLAYRIGVDDGLFSASPRWTPE